MSGQPTGDARAQLLAVLAEVGAGFEGDAETAAEAFTEDAVFLDTPGQPLLAGRDAIEAFFLAFGGRREQFQLGEIVIDGDRAAVEYAVTFRADAHAYGQRGVAWVRLRDGLVASWRGVWVETSEDLSSWGGD